MSKIALPSTAIMCQTSLFNGEMTMAPPNRTIPQTSKTPVSSASLPSARFGQHEDIIDLVREGFSTTIQLIESLAEQNRQPEIIKRIVDGFDLILEELAKQREIRIVVELSSVNEILEIVRDIQANQGGEGGATADQLRATFSTILNDLKAVAGKYTPPTKEISS